MTRAEDVLRDATLSGVCASSARDMARMADASVSFETARSCGSAAGHLWRLAFEARDRAEQAMRDVRGERRAWK